MTVLEMIGTTLLKAAPAAIASLLKPILAPIGSQLKEFSKDKWESYTASLEDYLTVIYKKHCYFNSEVFSNEGKLLEHYYVPLTLEMVSHKEPVPKIKIDTFPNDLFAVHKDILVVDTAGMGKSTLLKFIFLKQIEKGGSIPIFIELRRISKETPFLTFLMSELKIGGDSVNEAFLKKCLQDGIFTFYLDGFDEVSDELKKHVSNELVQLKTTSNGNRFILSSREEPSLYSLNEFRRFRIKPLEKDEAFILIRKLASRTEIAESLIKKLSEAKEDNLDEFLRNPLLVSLLVKSYLHSPVLPVRLSEFYRQVFDALYQNHDARKELGGYARKKNSGLDLDKFHKALRALGYVTYRDAKLEFTTDELLIQIERAKTLISDSQFSATDFQDDLLRAVPIFVKEGNSLRWAHRSLQEYFAAAYICMDAKGRQEKILLKLCEQSPDRNANLLQLCADIDEKTFKHSVLKKYLKEWIEKIDNSYKSECFPLISTADLHRRRLFRTFPVQRIIYFKRAIRSDGVFNHIDDESLKLLHNETDVQIFFWELDATFDSRSHDDDEKIKYMFLASQREDNVILWIIQKFFAKKIFMKVEKVIGKRTLKNIEHGIPIQIDDSPLNPLNQPENFNIVTDLIINCESRIWDEKEIKRFYFEIVEEEKRASDLELSFD